MEPAQEGEQGPSGPHGGRGQPFSPMARGLLSLRVRVRQLGRVGGAAGPTGSSAWNVLSPEQRPASSPAEAAAEAPGQPCRWFGGLYPPSPSSAQPPTGLPAWPRAHGRQGPTAPYQADVERVVVILRHGHVHGQGHAVGKDGQQDDGLEGSAASVKE